MEYIETEIQGVYIIKPKVFFDARGTNNDTCESS